MDEKKKGNKSPSISFVFFVFCPNRCLSDLLSPMAIYIAYLKANGHNETFMELMITLKRPREA